MIVPILIRCSEGAHTKMKETSRPKLVLLLVLLTSFTFVTIQPINQTGATTLKTIKIGVVTDLTTAYSYYGGQEVTGLALGLAYAVGATNVTQAIQSTGYGYKVTGGGYEFDLYVADGKSDPTASATAAVNLITTDGVQILQGAPDSDSAIAVAAVAASYKVLFMAGPAADYDITASSFNVYTFRMASNSYQDALTGGAYAVQNVGNKTFSLIAPQDSWGSAEVAEWTDVINNAGGTILQTQYAPTTTTDFTPYIDNILSSHAGCLIPAWAGAGAVQLFTGLNTLGVYSHMKVFTGVPDLATWNFVLAPLMPAYGLGFVGMMKYAYNLPTSNAASTWLIHNYIKLFQKDKLPEQTALTFPFPDLFIPDSFATGQAIVQALTITGGNTAAPYMIQALEGMTVNTPKGSMYIRPEDHQALQSMYVVKVVLDIPSTFSKYYNASGQFPAGSYWAGIITTGYEGVSLITTMTGTQTAPPIYPGAASAPRPTLPTVKQPIKLTVVAPGVSATATLSGCSVSPTSVILNGAVQYVWAKKGCTITVTLPHTSKTRYVGPGSKSSLSITTCSSLVCSTYSAAIHEQFLVTVVRVGLGTISPSGNNWYNAGSTIGIKAIPLSGHTFKKWSSSTTLIKIASPTAKITTAKISGAGTITATFV
jgi:branched-chain amino acid transport system substrate-binding protein